MRGVALNHPLDLSGKHRKNVGKSPILLGKSTILTGSFLIATLNYQRVIWFSIVSHPTIGVPPFFGKPQVMIARLKKKNMPLRRLRYESWVHKRWGWLLWLRKESGMTNLCLYFLMLGMSSFNSFSIRAAKWLFSDWLQSWSIMASISPGLDPFPPIFNPCPYPPEVSILDQPLSPWQLVVWSAPADARPEICWMWSLLGMKPSISEKTAVILESTAWNVRCLWKELNHIQSYTHHDKPTYPSNTVTQWK